MAPIGRAQVELAELGHFICRNGLSALSVQVDDQEGEDAEQIRAVAERHGLKVSTRAAGEGYEVVVECPRGDA
jgi:hypothetical protein